MYTESFFNPTFEVLEVIVFPVPASINPNDPSPILKLEFAVVSIFCPFPIAYIATACLSPTLIVPSTVTGVDAVPSA